MDPSQDQVLGWFDALSNRGRWGADDRRGTLNHITADKRATAASLVRHGVAVSCSWDIDPGPAPAQPWPAQRFMLRTGEGEPERRGGAVEHLGFVYHGYRITHLDALSHIFWEGAMYNGLPATAVTAEHGATELDVTGARDGIVTRGVLLDVAASEGVDWLEPGTAVRPTDLERAEARQGVEVGEGDVVLLRTGYGASRRTTGGDPDPSSLRAGWHAACLPWLHQRQVAAIGADTAQDAKPSGYADIDLPIHAVGIVAMGLWLIDNCDLEDLAAACARYRRWEFLFVLAPLPFRGATGSPANPLAVF